MLFLGSAAGVEENRTWETTGLWKAGRGTGRDIADRRKMDQAMVTSSEE